MSSEIPEELMRKLVKKVLEEQKKRLHNIVDEKSPHGVYLYIHEVGKWELVREDGEPFKLGEFGDGVYVVYFDNTRCPACRKYDKHWYPYIDKYCKATGCGDTKFVIILCEWFARNCKAKAAAKTFENFKVTASPTTIVALVEGGKVVYKEKYEGYLTIDELEKVVGEFKDRAERAKRGEKVEPPIRKGTTEELLKLLLKQLGIEI